MRVHADRAALTTRGRFAANIDDFAHLRPFSEAGDPGIEPEAAVLETAVLPLHQSPWPFAPRRPDPIRRRELGEEDSRALACRAARARVNVVHTARGKMDLRTGAPAAAAPVSQPAL